MRETVSPPQNRRKSRSRHSLRADGTEGTLELLAVMGPSPSRWVCDTASTMSLPHRAVAHDRPGLPPLRDLLESRLAEHAQHPGPGTRAVDPAVRRRVDGRQAS